MACSTTDIGILQVGRVLWDPSAGQPSLVRPIVRVLRFPRPLNPTLTLLIGGNLCFPILSEEGLVIRAERIEVACLAGAAPDSR